MTKNDEFSGFEVAVIGLDVRFPGASDIDEFWVNLTQGVESISFFNEEELKSIVPPHLLNDPNYIKAAGYLEGTEYFDSSFFENDVPK